jgi:transcriptional regulator with XRE-family HTH domain
MRDVAAVFAEKLRALRKLKGLSQESLAEKISVDPLTIRNYETKRRFPSAEMIGKLADAVAAEPWEFFGTGELKRTTPAEALEIIGRALGIEKKAGEVPEEIASLISRIPLKRLRDLKDILEQFVEPSEIQTVKKT